MKNSPFSDDMKAALTAISDKKVEDLKIIQVGDLVGYTEYFIIGTGNSITHVQAMANAVMAAVKKPGGKGLPVEGFQSGQWILIDADDFVVHLFQPKERKYYALDDLWSDGNHLPFPDSEV